jgi:sugar phosphate isomerase/epimerase
MKPIRLAAPLFILREEAQKDLFSVLEKLQKIGYDGIEFLGLFGHSASQVRQKLDELSLKALGDHVNVDEFIKEPERVIEEHLEIGCEYLTLAWNDRSLKPGDPAFQEMLDYYRVLSQKCLDAGLIPQFHNHDFEFRTDPPIVDQVLDYCEKDGLCFEPDLGWMVYMQQSPEHYLTKYASRCRVLHFKDVYAEDFSLVGDGQQVGTQTANPDNGYFEFRPTGYGLVNFPKLMPLCLACNPDWIVMDHDLAYDRDPFEDLKLSLDYTKNLLKLLGE